MISLSYLLTSRSNIFTYYKRNAQQIQYYLPVIHREPPLAGRSLFVSNCRSSIRASRSEASCSVLSSIDISFNFFAAQQPDHHDATYQNCIQFASSSNVWSIPPTIHIHKWHFDDGMTIRSWTVMSERTYALHQKQ